MKHKVYVGIDNGTSGTIGILHVDGSEFVKTPKTTGQSYTKKKQNVSRLDHVAFKQLMERALKYADNNPDEVCIAIERPLVNPGRFKASISGIRCYEATILILEQLGLPYLVCDSKNWQSKTLPLVTGSKALKEASRDVGCRMFPEHEQLIKKHTDADGIMIAVWARMEDT